MSFDRQTPFTSAEARAAGVSQAALRGAAFRRLHYGVHVASGSALDLQAECRAALLVLPEGAVLSRWTAARLWGGVVPHRSRLTATVPHRASARSSTVDVFRARTMPESTSRRGLPVTTPERTFLDLAHALDLVDLVVLGDSLVRRGVTTPEALVAAAGPFRGPRTARARRAAGLVRNGVDSPMETRVRLLLLLAGLPEPVVNHVVRDEHGEWVHRFDLSYPDLRLVIEYDGRQHAESSVQWVRDVRRREQLDLAGWRLLVVLAADVYAAPGATVDRVRSAIRHAGGNPGAASDEWRGHFPERQG